MIRLLGVVAGVILGILISLLIGVQGGSAQHLREFDITFEEMAYKDITLTGPVAQTYYYFSLPPDWVILDGSRLILDVDVTIHSTKQSAKTLLALDVELNEQILFTQEVTKSTLSRLQIDIPADYFHSYEHSRPNVLKMKIREYGECGESISRTTIRNSSELHLPYAKRPPPTDLSLFPKPIYQRWTFEPKHVRFILPDDFNEADAQAAAIIAARLGQLSTRNFPISVTVASKQALYTNLDEHQIIIGTPDKNPLIRELPLPISASQRQLTLYSQTPMTIAPGSIFTQTFFVANTKLYSQPLLLENRLAPQIEFLDCALDLCEQREAGNVRWNIGTLNPGERISETMILQASPIVSLNQTIRQSAVLLHQDGDILNEDTAIIGVGKTTNTRPSEPQVKPDYFFSTNNQPIPSDAGILQEIVAPWNESAIVITVTGLDDKAVLQAANGLNPKNNFPGIWGDIVIVKETNLVSPTKSALPPITTFDTLGYNDRELNLLAMDGSEYRFYIPSGIRLGTNSYLSLHVSHAQLQQQQEGGMKIFLNGVPIGSVRLDDSNANNALINVPLNPLLIHPGANIIRLQSYADDVDRCNVNPHKPYWLEIYRDSFIHLNYILTDVSFKLNDFPYPFSASEGMSAMAFSLSTKPSLTEIEGLLQLALTIGRVSKGKDLLSGVLFGNAPDDALSNVDIIAMGLPTENPIIQSVNGYLPLPFASGSNEISQGIDSPVYNIPPDADLGVLQIITSPWNYRKALLLVSGSTEGGFRWGVDALAQSYRDLNGDLSLVRGGKIRSLDTNPVKLEDIFDIPIVTATSASIKETPLLQIASTPTHAVILQASASPTPTLTALPTATSTPATPSVSSAKPRWLLPLLGIALIGFVGSVFMWFRKMRHI